MFSFDQKVAHYLGTCCAKINISKFRVLLVHKMSNIAGSCSFFLTVTYHTAYFVGKKNSLRKIFERPGNYLTFDTGLESVGCYLCCDMTYMEAQRNCHKFRLLNAAYSCAVHDLMCREITFVTLNRSQANLVSFSYVHF